MPRNKTTTDSQSVNTVRIQHYLQPQSTAERLADPHLNMYNNNNISVPNKDYYKQRHNIVAQKIEEALDLLFQTQSVQTRQINVFNVLDNYGLYIFNFFQAQYSTIINLPAKDCLAMLLSNPDSQGIYWLNEVINHNDRELLNMLLQYAKTTSINLTSIKDVNDNTLLQRMIHAAMDSLLPCLLSCNYKIDEKDRNGKSAIDRIFEDVLLHNLLRPIALLLTLGAIDEFDHRLQALFLHMPGSRKHIQGLCIGIKCENALSNADRSHHLDFFQGAPSSHTPNSFQGTTPPSIPNQNNNNNRPPPQF